MRSSSEIIVPLVLSEVLLPVGIPFANSANARMPGPYLPTARTFVTALFGDNNA